MGLLPTLFITYIIYKIIKNFMYFMYILILIDLLQLRAIPKLDIHTIINEYYEEQTFRSLLILNVNYTLQIKF